MNQFDDEFAARKQRRMMESLHESPVTDHIGDAAEIVGKGAAVGSALIPPLAPVLVPIGAAASGVGILKKALRLGKPTAEKMIEDLEFATDTQIGRIWAQLGTQTDRQNAFEERLYSHEAQITMLNECFHGLRTSDPAKHRRLAVIAVNSIYEDDFSDESLDSMMRAAVELTGPDIAVLGLIYEMQRDMFDLNSMDVQQGQRMNHLQRRWQEWWTQNIDSYRGIEGRRFNNSCARLQAAGLIASIGAKSFAASPTTSNHELLLDGKKFYERIQEVAGDGEKS
ncbi:MAG: hypothetical protein WBE72_11230 [Terracidiphilus sp.]